MLLVVSELVVNVVVFILLEINLVWTLIHK